MVLVLLLDITEVRTYLLSDTRYVELVQGQNNNQLPFNKALKEHEGKIDYAVLPAAEFPNGARFAKNPKAAVWAHANWIVGLAAKTAFLKRHGFWHVALGGASGKTIGHMTLPTTTLERTTGVATTTPRATTAPAARSSAFAMGCKPYPGKRIVLISGNS